MSDNESWRHGAAWKDGFSGREDVLSSHPLSEHHASYKRGQVLRDALGFNTSANTTIDTIDAEGLAGVLFWVAAAAAFLYGLAIERQIYAYVLSMLVYHLLPNDVLRAVFFPMPYLFGRPIVFFLTGAALSLGVKFHNYLRWMNLVVILALMLWTAFQCNLSQDCRTGTTISYDSVDIHFGVIVIVSLLCLIFYTLTGAYVAKATKIAVTAKLKRRR